MNVWLHKMKVGLLFALFFSAVAIIGAVIGDFPKWDHLSVKFPEYNGLPMEEADAINDRWTLFADNCDDSSTPFVGRRYMLNGDQATILIYDVNGGVAGMQMSFKADLKKGEYGENKGAFQLIEEEYGDYYYVTAYFTEPTKVCNASHARPKGVIGDRLVFLTGVNEYMTAPLLEKDLSNTKWVVGKCFPGMGQHYWYDISKEMNCNDVFPAFLMYSGQGHLNAWGFLADVQIPGKRVEHPRPWALWAFFKSETKPKCLDKLKHRSTQHVYFTEVGWFSHSCIW